jgi:hypothetical protein
MAGDWKDIDKSYILTGNDGKFLFYLFVAQTADTKSGHPKPAEINKCSKDANNELSVETIIQIARDLIPRGFIRSHRKKGYEINPNLIQHPSAAMILVELRQKSQCTLKDFAGFYALKYTAIYGTRQSDVETTIEWLKKAKYVETAQVPTDICVSDRANREYAYLRLLASLAETDANEFLHSGVETKRFPSNPLREIILSAPLHHYHLTLDKDGRLIWRYTIIEFHRDESDPENQRMITSAIHFSKAGLTENLKRTYQYKAWFIHGGNLFVQASWKDDVAFEVYPQKGLSTGRPDFCWCGTISITNTGDGNPAGSIVFMTGEKFEYALDADEGQPISDPATMDKLQEKWETEARTISLKRLSSLSCRSTIPAYKLIRMESEAAQVLVYTVQPFEEPDPVIGKEVFLNLDKGVDYVYVLDSEDIAVELIHNLTTHGSKENIEQNLEIVCNKVTINFVQKLWPFDFSIQNPGNRRRCICYLSPPGTSDFIEWCKNDQAFSIAADILDALGGTLVRSGAHWSKDGRNLAFLKKLENRFSESLTENVKNMLRKFCSVSQITKASKRASGANRTRAKHSKSQPPRRKSPK